jgi:hypothetical protein
MIKHQECAVGFGGRILAGVGVLTAVASGVSRAKHPPAKVGVFIDFRLEIAEFGQQAPVEFHPQLPYL